MHALSLAAALALATGCAKGSDCTATITRMGEAQVAETKAMLAKLSGPEKAIVGPKIEKALAGQGRRTALTIQRCHEDAWPEDVLGCIDGASAETRGACLKKLPPAKLDALTKALRDDATASP